MLFFKQSSQKPCQVAYKLHRFIKFKNWIEQKTNLLSDLQQYIAQSIVKLVESHDHSMPYVFFCCFHSNQRLKKIEPYLNKYVF